MAPTKRAAAKAAGAAAGRPAKAAKKAAPEPKAEVAAPAAPTFPAPLQGALFSLGKAGVAGPATIAALRDTLPFALVEERHAYQAEVAQRFRTLIEQADEKLVAGVVAAEARVAEVARDKAASGERLEEAKRIEADKVQTCEAAEAASRAAEAAQDEAAAVVQRETLAQTEADAAVKGRSEAKEAYEKSFSDKWTPVKTGAFVGKEWRAKHKAIDELSELLALSTAPTALALALPVALKEKPEARGAFGREVVDRGEVAFKGHIELMASQINELQAAADARAQAVARANEDAAAKAAAVAAARQASIDAHSQLVEANYVVCQLEDRDFASQEATAAAALEVGRKALSELRAHAEAVEALGRPAPTPEAPAPQGQEAVPAPQAPAAEPPATEEAPAAPQAEAMSVDAKVVEAPANLTMQGALAAGA